MYQIGQCILRSMAIFHHITNIRHTCICIYKQIHCQRYGKKRGNFNKEIFVPGSCISEDKSPSWLCNFLLCHVKTQRSASTAQLVQTIRTFYWDRTNVIQSFAGLRLQNINPDVPKTLLAPAALSIEVTIIEMKLVWDPHDALWEIFLINNKMTAIFPSLNSDKVFSLMIRVKMTQKFWHRYPEKIILMHFQKKKKYSTLPLLTCKIYTINQSELAVFFMLWDFISCVFNLQI